MPVSKLNLNLLRTLRTVLEQKNLSRSAEILRVSQPAISASMARLRRELGDKLLVRVGRRMELTPKAEEMVAELDSIFARLEVLFRPSNFDPLKEHRNVTIATTDYGAAVAAAPLIQFLRRDAPHISLQFVESMARLGHKASQNNIDFHLVPEVMLRQRTFSGTKSIRLFGDHFVKVRKKRDSLSSKEHPGSESSYAVFDYGPGFIESGPRHVLESLIGNKSIAIKVEQFSILCLIASQIDLVAIVPNRLFGLLKANMPIERVDDYDSLYRFDFCLAWKSSLDEDAFHKWMRMAFVKVLS